ncbi:hypothetical protein GCWU000341_02480 [Oribacterium sp. oral taxon 078 str. F0262]|nr:hypothetical protein GCWU000341_02480 [Oribacterium sp. oral taxon 078 str. F0262]
MNFFAIHRENAILNFGMISPEKRGFHRGNASKIPFIFQEGFLWQEK